jgi:hypothetical protein
MGSTGAASKRVGHERDGRSVIDNGRGPATNQLKCRLTAFLYYHGMLLEPVDYLVLLIGTLASTGWGFVLLGLS